MVLDAVKKYRIILASRSPRRQELLSGMGLDFEVRQPDVEEVYPPHLSPEEIPAFLAEQKLSGFNRDELPDNVLLIGCDTLVFLDRTPFGKAYNATEAAQMLQQLSGKTHSVISGLCVQTKQHQITETAISKVRFKTFSEAEVDYYIQKYQPFDKAGAYGIQEWLGYIGVESIEGSFYNIMGLPTATLWKILEKIAGT